MWFDDSQERANKSALILAHERYSAQYAPFIKGSRARLNYVSSHIDRIACECAKEVNGDEDWLKKRLWQIVEEELEERESANYKNDPRGVPGPGTENPVTEIPKTDVKSRGDVEGAGLEEALKPEGLKVVDLRSEAAQRGLAEFVGKTLPPERLAELKESSPWVDILAEAAQMLGLKGIHLEDPNEILAAAAQEAQYPHRLEQLGPTQVNYVVNAYNGSLRGASKEADRGPRGIRVDRDLNTVQDAGMIRALTDEIEEALEQGDEERVRELIAELRSLVSASNRRDREERRNMGAVKEAIPYGEEDVHGTGTGIADQELAADQPHSEGQERMECAICREMGVAREGSYEDILAHVQQDHQDRLQQAAKTAEVPRTHDDAAQVQPLPESPADRFDEYIQDLANRAAARRYSYPDSETLHSLASQLGIGEDDLRSNLHMVATFGPHVGVNGELVSSETDTSTPEGYQEVSVEGTGGSMNARQALVPVDLVVSKVAEEMNMEQDLAYTMVRDKYGDDLPERYNASVSGEQHFYLPAEMAAETQPDPEVGPTPQPPQQAPQAPPQMPQQTPQMV
jgi:hypothetical protein